MDSASDDVLKRFSKNTTADQVYKAMKYLTESNIPLISYGFIMYDPEVTLEDIRLNLSFLLRYPYFNILTLNKKVNAYCGTKIRRKLIEDNNLFLKEWYDIGEWKFTDSNVELFYNLAGEIIKNYFMPLEERIRYFEKHSILENSTLNNENKDIINQIIISFEKKVAKYCIEILKDIHSMITKINWNTIDKPSIHKKTKTIMGNLNHDLTNIKNLTKKKKKNK